MEDTQDRSMQTSKLELKTEEGSLQGWATNSLTSKNVSESSISKYTYDRNDQGPSTSKKQSDPTPTVPTDHIRNEMLEKCCKALRDRQMAGPSNGGRQNCVEPPREKCCKQLPKNNCCVEPPKNNCCVEPPQQNCCIESQTECCIDKAEILAEIKEKTRRHKCLNKYYCKKAKAEAVKYRNPHQEMFTALEKKQMEENAAEATNCKPRPKVKPTPQLCTLRNYGRNKKQSVDASTKEPRLSVGTAGAGAGAEKEGVGTQTSNDGVGIPQSDIPQSDIPTISAITETTNEKKSKKNSQDIPTKSVLTGTADDKKNKKKTQGTKKLAAESRSAPFTSNLMADTKNINPNSDLKDAQPGIANDNSENSKDAEAVITEPEIQPDPSDVIKTEGPRLKIPPISISQSQHSTSTASSAKSGPKTYISGSGRNGRF